METTTKNQDAGENVNDSIVISGIAGIMPGCNNMKDFAEKLYGKVNMAKCGTPRWDYKHPELPKYQGLIEDLDKFDAQFFMVHYKLAHVTDSMSRKLIELSYQAIFDSGISPTELSNKHVACLIVTGLNEAEKSESSVNVALLGKCRSMAASRISYRFNLKGPSMVVDSSCSSTVLAIQKAVQMIKSGHCEAAIIGSAKLALHPQSYIAYHRVVPMNPDGETKSFDANADGQSVSEAACTMFIQKHKDAKRVYAIISGATMEYTPPGVDYSLRYGPFRPPGVISNFLKSFYEKVGVSPYLVEYVEGYGAAMPDADKSELLAIEEIFTKHRADTLFVGSIMSNLGYTEAASAACAIFKVLLAYQRGLIPGNLHYTTPHTDIPSIKEGRMQIVNDNQKFNRTYAAINSFAMTGNSGHMLLEGSFKPKDLAKYDTNIPYLVTASGRQEVGVKKILTHIKEKPLDPEEIALLHNIHRIRVFGHLSRGFGIFGHKEGKRFEETEQLSEKVDYYNETKGPLWFVYSGMGSQWATMGAQLMAIPLFAEAIERCHNVLVPKGVDLKHILTADDPAIYDNILNSFIGIAAVQVGLTDILHALGLVPDKIIGHSVGELGCAYADGCITAEEMMLASYSRGLVSVQTPFIRGTMAAVGIGYQKISTMCPPEIEVACHNGPDSSTISGPAEVVKEFVDKLMAQGIFAKEVPCSNIAYHSRYIAEAGPALLHYLKDVIKTPKLRSEKWVSTSVPLDKWDEEEAKYSSAEYHTNNLLNPVLFEETSKLIPPNSIIVEIAPHGLLQAILKRSLPVSCHHVPLCRKTHPDNVLHLLEAVGKLYMAGCDLDIAALYPRVQFPVSTETASLSHLVEWAHVDVWHVCKYQPVARMKSAIYNQVITTMQDEYEYLSGHVIEGQRVYPFSATLVAVWQTFASSLDKPASKTSVQMSDVNLYLQPLIYDQRPIHLTVYIQSGCGRFEVLSGNDVVADGYITEDKAKIKELNDAEFSIDFCKIDVYKMFYERGYDYREVFRSVNGVNRSFTQGQVEWNNDWGILIDGMFQLLALKRDHTAISQPQRIKHLKIDPRTLTDDDYQNTKVFVDEIQNQIMCKGITMAYVSMVDKAPIARQFLGTKALKFVPFHREENVDSSHSLYVMLQIVAENVKKDYVNLYEITSGEKITIMDQINHLLNGDPGLKVNVTRTGKEDFLETKTKIENLDVVVLYDLISDMQILESLYHIIPLEAFVISIGVESKGQYPLSIYEPVCSFGKGKTKIELARWRPTPARPFTHVTVKSPADYSLLQGKFSCLSSNQELLVLTSYPAPQGLKDVVKHLRCHSNKDIKMVMINHKISKEQDVKKLPKFNLAYNVLDHGIWGGEYYVPITKEDSGKDQNYKLHMSSIGDLNSLQWVGVAADSVKQSGIEVKVHYAGLNVYDAKRARAEWYTKNSGDDAFGMDYSGVTKSGERVMGITLGGSARTLVHAQPNLLWPVPKHWNLEEAATVPLPYIQAFYCLAIKTKIMPGLKVLVHGGAGALGQAVISIALAFKCKVFTTVSTIQKKRFLMQMFPDLRADNIGNSRDVTFSDMVLTATKGEGCDIVISCVMGELKHASIACCATAGHTVDVTQIHRREDFVYGMYHMTKMRSYLPVDFTEIFTQDNAQLLKKLQLMIAEGVSRGYVRPLSRVIYSPHEAPQAFRLLAASRHRGRALLKMRDTMPFKKLMLVASPISCHLLIFDREEFGVMCAERLIRRGVKKLLLQCSNTSTYLRFKIESWKKQGIMVKLYSADLSNETILTLLNDANSVGSIEAIYILTTRTADGKVRMNLLSSLSNLDLASRKLCPYNKYFSIISDNSNDGQQICLDRAQYGLPAMSLRILDMKLFDDPVTTYGSTTALSCHGVLELIEKSLMSKEPLVLAYGQALPTRPILQELADIPALNISSSTTEKTKLEDIGVDAGLAQEVTNMLLQKYSIVVNKEKLPEMTIENLNQMNKDLMEIDLKSEVTGFDAYISNVDKDELEATLEFKHMKTLIQNSELRSDEFDMTLKYLYVVPGLEGHFERFQPMCELLKLPAIVLQPGLDQVGETLDQTAQRLVNMMLKKLKVSDKFYLLGYEFGVLIVMKMAAILESCGFTGKVFLIGGSPQDVQNSLQYQLQQLPSKSWQIELAVHLSRLLSGEPLLDLSTDLQSAKTWEDKVEKCIFTLHGRVKYTLQFLRNLFHTFYARINLFKSDIYQPKGLKSELILLRPVLPFAKTEDLKNYFRQPFTTYELSATAPHAYLDQKCATIINRHVDKEEIEIYESRKFYSTFIGNYDFMAYQ